jgi:hypothetical protein
METITSEVDALICLQQQDERQERCVLYHLKT